MPTITEMLTITEHDLAEARAENARLRAENERLGFENRHFRRALNAFVKIAFGGNDQ
jgi:regulator of replication initiation timing